MKVGLIVASGYSLYILLAYFVTAGGILERRGVSFSLLELVAVYYVGGLSGGIIYGVFSPLAKWRFGAYLLGVLIMVPASIAAVSVIPHARFNEPLAWGVVAFMSAVIGGIGGLIVFEPDTRRRR